MLPLTLFPSIDTLSARSKGFKRTQCQELNTELIFYSVYDGGGGSKSCQPQLGNTLSLRKSTATITTTMTTTTTARPKKRNDSFSSGGNQHFVVLPATNAKPRRFQQEHPRIGMAPHQFDTSVTRGCRIKSRATDWEMQTFFSWN